MNTMMKMRICEKVKIDETSSDNQQKHICKYIKIYAIEKKRFKKRKKRITWISFVFLIIVLEECVSNNFFF